MPSLTLRRIPPALYGTLKAQAEANHRSLNAEILHRLERSLRPQRPTSSEVAERVAARAESLRLPPLSNRLLRGLKEKGRP